MKILKEENQQISHETDEEISYQATEEIRRLIVCGEDLDVHDLVMFYQWVDDSYEALGFDHVWQLLFDRCCRSSSDDHFTRLCFGRSVLQAVLKKGSLTIEH